MHILHIMLENSEKGYHMVKKACTMMHSLIDNWKPPPGTFRSGKPWSTVIPVHISTRGYECWIGIPLVRSCVFFSQDLPFRMPHEVKAPIPDRYWKIKTALFLEMRRRGGEWVLDAAAHHQSS